jgi:large subunit ribosomal protein L4
MLKTKVYNQKAQEVGELELSDKIFAIKVNEALVHQAMVAEMANQRQVLAHTKDRSEVRGGGKKPWRQKGTGRARAGSSRSPIWIGGGVTFGPLKSRNFKKEINKKMKQKAVYMVLSDKVANKNFAILDKLEMEEFKTKNFDSMVKNIEEKVFIGQNDGKDKKTKRSMLIINDKADEKNKFSARNLPGIKLINITNIKITDLLKYKNLVLSSECVKELNEKNK